MLDIFEFKDGKLGLTIDVLAHPILRKIYDRDEDTHKGEAIMQYTYLNYMCSYRKTNPFSGYPTRDERRIKIIASIYKNREKEEKQELLEFYTNDSLINICIGVLDHIYETCSPSLELYKGCLESSKKLATFLREIDLTAETKSGGLKYNPDTIAKNIKESRYIVLALNDLKNAVDSELVEASKTVKNRSINYFEMVENATE